jgi:hypothetical protein
MSRSRKPAVFLVRIHRARGNFASGALFNGHSPRIPVLRPHTTCSIKEEKHGSRMKETTREHIPQRQALFNTTKHCMGNGSDGGMGAKKGGGGGRKRRKRKRPARQREKPEEEKRKKKISLLFDGHAFSCGRRTDTGFLRVLVLCSCGVCGALGILCAGFLL